MSKKRIKARIAALESGKVPGMSQVGFLRSILKNVTFLQSMDTAPKDGTLFIAYSEDPTGSGLPSFWSWCSWHPEAGFCTDEIREPVGWLECPEELLSRNPLEFIKRKNS